ncbi:hypothetical protein ACIP6P_00690 [Streptomyces sp. NPDC088729]|uniref:hypothetical protein n=1 Tax=Streptomyces sp. NPDC088729 TaxID=3365876 RepID=UPI00382DD069
MAGLDALLGASVEAVKRSGALENNAFMATVSAVNSDGTVDCSRAGDAFPSVRVLSGYLNPRTGDSVEILRSAGGWVCVGAVMTSSAPRYQAGTANLAVSGTSATLAVNFPNPFASLPVVVASLATGNGTFRYWSARAISASLTGFTAMALTSDAAAPSVTGESAPVAWHAFTS